MMKSALAFLNNLNPDFVKLLKGSGLVMGFKVLGAIAGFAITYVVTKNFGEDGYGVFELCLTLLTILSLFSRAGIDSALVRFIPEFRDKKDQHSLNKVYALTMMIALPVSVVFSVGLYLFADQVAVYFGSENLATSFRYVSIVIPFSTWLGLNSEAFRGMTNMIAYSFYQRGTVLVIAIGAIYYLISQDFAAENTPFVAFGIGVISLSIMAGIAAPLKLKNLTSAKPSDEHHVDKKEEKAHKVFKISSLSVVAFPMLLSTTMFIIMNWTDTIMIGIYLEESEVGVYRLAFKVAALVTFAQFAVSSIAAPMFSSYKTNNDMQGMKKITRNIGFLNIIISTPIFLVIIIFPNFILGIFGEGYSNGGSLPLTILATGSIINAICGPVMYLLNMTGREEDVRNILIVSSIANFVLNLIFIPRFGLLGAACATALSTILWNVLGVIKIKQVYGFLSIPNPFEKIS